MRPSLPLLLLLLLLLAASCAPGPRGAGPPALSPASEAARCASMDDRRRAWTFAGLSVAGASAAADLASVAAGDAARPWLLASSALLAAVAGAATWVAHDYGTAYARDCGPPPPRGVAGAGRHAWRSARRPQRSP